MSCLVAVLDDLFFTVKIMDAAKQEGLAAIFVKDEDKVLALALEKPAVIIIDLNIKALNAVDLIRTLKQNPETASIRILAFVSHVQVELRASAISAGADQVLPRSTFSQNLRQSLVALPSALASE